MPDLHRFGQVARASKSTLLRGLGSCVSLERTKLDQLLA
jgi:hypothetical protein